MESDALDVVKSLVTSDFFGMDDNIAEDIRLILKINPGVSIHHCPKNENYVARVLARLCWLFL